MSVPALCKVAVLLKALPHQNRMAADGHSRRLGRAAAAAALVVLTVCAAALLVLPREGHVARAGPAALLGGGIDEYLGDLYGKGARAGSFGLLHERMQARHRAGRGMSRNMLLKRLGLHAFAAPRNIASGDGDGGDDSGSPIQALRQEEALDAFAEGVSKADRTPCAGKPCFDVVNGLHAGGHKK